MINLTCISKLRGNVGIFMTAALVFLTLYGAVIAKEVYQWTDSKGTTHITDNKAKIPQEFLSTVKKMKWDDSGKEDNIMESEHEYAVPSPETKPFVDEIIDTIHERELREIWRAKALEIEQEEADIEYKLEQAKKEQEYKKREVDWYLRNGYQADYSIRELKGLERYIKDLEEELTTIPPKLDALRIEARKAGIPESYLRK